MKHVKLLMTAAILATSALSANAAFAKELNPQTKKNLEAAMHGEAYANLKYRTYAEKAREGGNEELAKLFEQSADVEAHEHFAREADAFGLGKSDKENLKESISSEKQNLRDAAAGEHYEKTTMYKQFAEQAAKVGDVEVAKLFEQIRADESDHYEAYKTALDKLEKSAPSKK